MIPILGMYFMWYAAVHSILLIIWTVLSLILKGTDSEGDKWYHVKRERALSVFMCVHQVVFILFNLIIYLSMLLS